MSAATGIVLLYAVSFLVLVCILWEVDRDARKQQRRRERSAAADKVALLDAEIDELDQSVYCQRRPPCAWLEHEHPDCVGDWHLVDPGTDRRLRCDLCSASYDDTSDNRVLSLKARAVGMELEMFARAIERAEAPPWES